MSMWETPARGDDTPQATPTSAADDAPGDTCSTCGGCAVDLCTNRCRIRGLDNESRVEQPFDNN